MRRLRFPLMILVLAALLLAGGCSESKHFVDIYVNDDCRFVLHDNDSGVWIDPMILFPGDYVYFNSLRTGSREITLYLPEGLFDKTGNHILKPGERILVRVIGTPGDTGTIGLSGADCPVTPPEFKIGDGP